MVKSSVRRWGLSQCLAIGHSVTPVTDVLVHTTCTDSRLVLTCLVNFSFVSDVKLSLLPQVRRDAERPGGVTWHCTT